MSLADCGYNCGSEEKPICTVGRVTVSSVIVCFYAMPCACVLECRVKCIGENKPIGVIYKKPGFQKGLKLAFVCVCVLSVFFGRIKVNLKWRKLTSK